MLVMLVVMLVEGVFLVSGVVKTLFPPNKNNRRKFFFFHHERKRVKADFVGVSKSPLFVFVSVRTIKRHHHLRKRREYILEFFFSSVKPFFIEVVPCIFLMAGENSTRVVEVVPGPDIKAKLGHSCAQVHHFTTQFIHLGGGNPNISLDYYDQIPVESRRIGTQSPGKTNV